MAGRFVYSIRFLEYENLEELTGVLDSLGAEGWRASQFMNNSKDRADTGSHGSWWVLTREV